MHGDRVYLLSEGDLPDRSAVIAFSLDGEEIGSWGEVGLNGILQANLDGGGITACPDGAVYFSYLNSPYILSVGSPGENTVVRLGRGSKDFEVIAGRRLRRARTESRESRSVVPLITLAREGSRVLALECSDEGLLFRQVAHPGAQGAVVEVWDPGSARMLNEVAVGGGILLDVRDRILFLGSIVADGPFTLERIRYEVVAEVVAEESGGRS